MTNFDKQFFDALLRTDLLSFVFKAFPSLNNGERLEENWHLQALTYHLQRCVDGDVTRSMITQPPRTLKSFVASVCLPAFLLGRDPSQKIICVSYGQDLAENFSEQCRNLMGQPWYREIFPGVALSKTKNAASEFATEQGGFRLSTSVGGRLTGRGADVIIIDDPLKGDEGTSEVARQGVVAWFNSSLQSRLNNMKTGKIILVNQRLHEDDLSGSLLEADPESWDHLSLQAIAEQNREIPIGDGQTHHLKEGDTLHTARFGLAELEKTRRQVGSYVFAAQYQQKPVPMAGNLIPVSSFRRYERRPLKQERELVVQSWDVATGETKDHDYSVATTWLYRPGRYVLLDVFRAQKTYSELLAEIVAQSGNAYADIILIEKAGIGGSLVSELHRLTQLNVVALSPKGDKVSRMIPGTADIEAGRVIVPREEVWLADFEHECAAFPYGKHDDQVDSLSQFLAWARNRGEAESMTAALIRGLDGLGGAMPSPANSSDLGHSQEQDLWEKHFGPHPNRTFFKS